MALKPMPPPRRRARLATVQPVTVDPTRGQVARRSSALEERETLAQHYLDQAEASRFARTDPARYPVWKVAQIVGRLVPQLQEKSDSDDDEWEKCTDDKFDGLLDEYANRTLGMKIQALATMQAYHYMVTGEYVIVITKAGEDHRDYRVYPMSACQWHRPKRGQVTVRDVAGGRVRDGTAYVVSEGQVKRCWNPDPDRPGQATSQLLCALEPLRRCDAITKQMKRQAESRFALGGGGKLIWTPAEAHEPKEVGGPSPVTEALQQMAEMGLDEYDLRSLIPPELHWDSKYGQPTVLDVSGPFDDKLIQGYNAAFDAFAQTLDMPGLSVKAGGPGEANHWNEWVLQDENWKAAGAPIADRVYDDITRVFWFGAEGDDGIGSLLGDNAEDYRIYYDDSEVVQGPDRGEDAERLWRAGLLNSVAVLEATGFNEADKLDDESEKEWLIEILSAGKVKADAEMADQLGVEAPPAPPVGPGNVEKVPPERPTEPPALPPGAPAAAAARPNGGRSKRAKALDRVQRMRRNLRTELRANAATWLREAVAEAGHRASARARNAKRGTRLAAVAPEIETAVRAETGIGPWLAVLGLTEQELLRERQRRYETGVLAILLASQARQREILDDADFDPDLAGTEDQARSAAGFLAAAVGALAFAALASGPPSAPEQGEVSGPVPASLIRQSVDVMGGQLEADLAPPGEVPGTVAAGGEDLPITLVREMGQEAAWTWVHGDPERPYEPHVELDGQTFTDPSETPEAEGWIPNPSATGGFQPGDHAGCTCEWHVEGVPPEATVE